MGLLLLLKRHRALMHHYQPMTRHNVHRARQRRKANMQQGWPLRAPRPSKDQGMQGKMLGRALKPDNPTAPPKLWCARRRQH